MSKCRKQKTAEKGTAQGAGPLNATDPRGGGGTVRGWVVDENEPRCECSTWKQLLVIVARFFCVYMRGDSLRRAAIAADSNRRNILQWSAGRHNPLAGRRVRLGIFRLSARRRRAEREQSARCRDAAAETSRYGPTVD